MGDSGLEKGLLCVFLIDVCRVQVAGYPCKKIDIRLRNGFGEFCRISCLEFLDGFSNHAIPLFVSLLNDKAVSEHALSPFFKLRFP